MLGKPNPEYQDVRLLECDAFFLCTIDEVLQRNWVSREWVVWEFAMFLGVVAHEIK